MRLEYSINVGGTESFRFASNKSPFGRGVNCQTFPKALRYYLTPPDGRVFVGGDLSQAEARVVAYLSKCKDLIGLFNDPSRHIHMENALVVFGHAVEKDSPEYVLAKAIIHAANYREGPYKFSVQAGIPVAITKRLFDSYHRKRPEIHQWHDWVWNEIKTKGMLTTPLGDERVFYEAISCFSVKGKMLDTQFKDAISWVPQATVPHVTNLGILNLRERYGDEMWFHHQGHDSWLVSVTEDTMLNESEIIDCFNIPLTCHGQTFVIPSELSYGWNFGDMLPWKGGRFDKLEWRAKVTESLQKRSRADKILAGTYGAMLKDFRV